MFDRLKYDRAEWTLIWANQNAPRPRKPYVMMNIITTNVPDHDWVDIVDDQGIEKLSSYRVSTFELQNYGLGADSYSKLNSIVQYFNSSSVNDFMFPRDVSFGPRLLLTDAPFLTNNSQYEQRSIYQGIFYWTDSVDDDVCLIETVIVDGDYVGSLTTVHCHEEITIAPGANNG
jgi:hypothetical protein